MADLGAHFNGWKEIHYQKETKLKTNASFA